MQGSSYRLMCATTRFRTFPIPSRSIMADVDLLNTILHFKMTEPINYRLFLKATTRGPPQICYVHNPLLLRAHPPAYHDNTDCIF